MKAITNGYHVRFLQTAFFIVAIMLVLQNFPAIAMSPEGSDSSSVSSVENAPYPYAELPYGDDMPGDLAFVEDSSNMLSDSYSEKDSGSADRPESYPPTSLEVSVAIVDMRNDIHFFIYGVLPLAAALVFLYLLFKWVYGLIVHDV